MPQVTLSTYRAALVAATALLAACSSLSNAPSSGVQDASREFTPATARVAQASKETEPTMYVQNQGGEETISVYANGGSRYLRTISKALYGFALDTKGHVFVAGPQIQNAGYPLYIYASKGAKLVQTIYQQRHPFFEPIVDSGGNLFVICANARVCEYRPGAGKEVLGPHAGRKIQLNPHKYVEAGPIAVGPNGNLAIANPLSVGVYPPRRTSPKWTVPLNQYFLSALTFDNTGNLYTAAGDQPAVISEYAAGNGSPKRVIEDSAGGSVASLGFDNQNNLYALTANKQAAAVSVYSSGESEPSRTITNGLVAGEAEYMSVAASGEVFVSNIAQTGSVVVYASGQDQPLRTVEIAYPSQIGLAP